MRARAFRWSAPADSGGQQQEDQIDRLFVDRVEVDGLFQPREHPIQTCKAGQLAVRDGDAIADAGGAQLLAFDQDVEDGALGQAGNLGGAACQFLQRLLFARGP